MLLADCFALCNCTVTAQSIEISPKGIPISKIKSFDNATRRIYMSATLADDSIFVSALGLKNKSMPSYLLTNITSPTCLCLSSFTIFSIFSLSIIFFSVSSQNFPRSLDGTIIKTLYRSDNNTIFSLISSSVIYRLLRQYENTEEDNQFVFFNLPLLADCFALMVL